MKIRVFITVLRSEILGRAIGKLDISTWSLHPNFLYEILCKLGVHPKVTSWQLESGSKNQWVRNRGTSMQVRLKQVLDLYVTLKSQLSALLSNFVNIHKILIINKFIFFYKNNSTQTSFKAVDIICFNFN